MANLEQNGYSIHNTSTTYSPCLLYWHFIFWWNCPTALLHYSYFGHVYSLWTKKNYTGMHIKIITQSHIPQWAHQFYCTNTNYPTTTLNCLYSNTLFSVTRSYICTTLFIFYPCLLFSIKNVYTNTRMKTATQSHMPQCSCISCILYQHNYI